MISYGSQSFCDCSLSPFETSAHVALIQPTLCDSSMDYVSFASCNETANFVRLPKYLRAGLVLSHSVYSEDSLALT